MAIIMKKTILMGLFIGIFAVFAMATTSAMSAVYASTDDDEEKPTQQCSLGSQDDKNCENARDNHAKHKEKVRDDNTNNDDGQNRALENLAYKSG